jgi:hypothetical protein
LLTSPVLKASITCLASLVFLSSSIVVSSAPWATKIAERYVGKKNAKTYGEVNSGEGSVLVRIKPTKVIAEKDVSILD